MSGLILRGRVVSRPSVKRMMMKLPTCNGEGSALTFFAKFDNYGEYTCGAQRKKCKYLTNVLEDLTVQVLWNLQSGSAVSYKRFQGILVEVYGSRGQSKVYRIQLKIVRRKKGESLIDLVQEIRRFIIVSFSGLADKTTDIPI